MDRLNFRLAEEKNFHTDILLFSFNPEHDIIVVCSANGDVYLNFLLIFSNFSNLFYRLLLIKHIFVKFGH
jgi:hypothetical protein